MGGIRRLQRSIARHATEQIGLKPNKQYKKKDETKASGLKVTFNTLYGKEEKK